MPRGTSRKSMGRKRKPKKKVVEDRKIPGGEIHRLPRGQGVAIQSTLKTKRKLAKDPRSIRSVKEVITVGGKSGRVIAKAKKKKQRSAPTPGAERRSLSVRLKAERARKKAATTKKRKRAAKKKR